MFRDSSLRICTLRSLSRHSGHCNLIFLTAVPCIVQPKLPVWTTFNSQFFGCGFAKQKDMRFKVKQEHSFQKLYFSAQVNVSMQQLDGVTLFLIEEKLLAYCWSSTVSNNNFFYNLLYVTISDMFRKLHRMRWKHLLTRVLRFHFLL